MYDGVFLRASSVQGARSIWATTPPRTGPQRIDEPKTKIISMLHFSNRLHWPSPVYSARPSEVDCELSSKIHQAFDAIELADEFEFCDGAVRARE
jgi:hypothetical protein